MCFTALRHITTTRINTVSDLTPLPYRSLTTVTTASGPEVTSTEEAADNEYYPSITLTSLLETADKELPQLTEITSFQPSMMLMPELSDNQQGVSSMEQLQSALHHTQHESLLMRHIPMLQQFCLELEGCLVLELIQGMLPTTTNNTTMDVPPGLDKTCSSVVVTVNSAQLKQLITLTNRIQVSLKHLDTVRNKLNNNNNNNNTDTVPIEGNQFQNHATLQPTESSMIEALVNTQTPSSSKFHTPNEFNNHQPPKTVLNHSSSTHRISAASTTHSFGGCRLQDGYDSPSTFK